jgi:SAM-dependent methyltransferase
MLEYGSRNLRRKLFEIFRYPASFVERVVWGGKWRETVLVWMLDQHYQSRFRREWVYRKSAPHFFNHRMGIFKFAFGRGDPVGPYSYYRGFFCSEVIQEGDRLLDIGCGDGFFTKRFYSMKCSQIDAIDIDKEAINSARSYNSGRNIRYYEIDAVRLPFPGRIYDVVVWDGAIGHFSSQDCEKVLKRISNVLSPEGVFAGSESLGGEEGRHDHLQFFSLDDLYVLFKAHFRHVQIRSVDYRIGWGSHLERREAYWRCSNSPSRLSASGWPSSL